MTRLMEPRVPTMLIATATSSILTLLMITANIAEGGGVGINWGRQTSQKLLPSMVVDMCLANGIDKVRFYSVNEGVLSAFFNSNIKIAVTIPSIELEDDPRNATREGLKAWVVKHITYYCKEKRLDIWNINFGVEPFSLLAMKKDGGLSNYQKSLPRIYEYVQKALDDEGLGKIKLTIPHGTDILKPFKKPSEADFRDDIKEIMLQTLQHHHTYDTPLMVNIFPHVACLKENFPMEFGFFDGIHNVSIVDGPLRYTNMFDLKYDAFLWALRKNGFDQIDVSVSQVGWPTDGQVDATPKNAKRFFDGLLKKLASKQGTPLQPGTQFETYVYALVDENERIFDRGGFERHYGIYHQDGKPKFHLDFSLQGRDIEPESAVGVYYLPQRWCVLNMNATKGNENLVKEIYNMTCKRADCTRLENGSTCSHLDYYDKVSYAFNMFFQMNNQDINGDACYFSGLGKVSNEKPEFGSCEFPVNILSTLFLNSMSSAEMEFTLGANQSFAQGRPKLEPALYIILPFLWLTLSRKKLMNLTRIVEVRTE